LFEASRFCFASAINLLLHQHHFSLEPTLPHQPLACPEASVLLSAWSASTVGSRHLILFRDQSRSFFMSVSHFDLHQSLLLTLASVSIGFALPSFVLAFASESALTLCQHQLWPSILATCPHPLCFESASNLALLLFQFI
jgi:hypothetical protein